MQRNATAGENDSTDLAPRQTQALGALLRGATITSAAGAAGVDRTTVHRWLPGDFAFQAAYNGLRRELHREAEVRLESLVHSALGTISTAIDDGDVRAALAVLKGAGVLAGSRPPIGPDDPAEVEEDAEVEARKRASVRTMQRISPI
jgi:hypothetical protein